MTLVRPRPPEAMAQFQLDAPRFLPAPDLLEWMIGTFVDPAAPLANEDHLHLNAAIIGVLWTNTQNSRHGRRIIGQAEFKPPGGTMGKWQRERARWQLHQWFNGQDLDFLLTFDAHYALEASDREFCALVEHELYHCGQAKDEFDGPKFHESTGLPVFAMRGHDVEEFVGVVRRYGAITSDVQAFVEAAMDGPEIERVRLDLACGTCHA